MKTIIFVIGMGRSGTSVLSRLLSLCGGTLPNQLIAANEINPRGYWEPREALDLNERFLRANGSSWFDPSPHLSVSLDLAAPHVEAFVTEIQALLRSWPSDGPLVVKEPRITTFAHLWFEAARREGLAVKVVIPVRDPIEVEMSLTAAGELLPTHGALLTLKYNLLAEHFSRGLPRVFVGYRHLLDDWRHEIARINQALDIALSPIDAVEIDEFLTPSLHRQHHSPDRDETIEPPVLGAVYRAFSAAAVDQPLDLAIVDRAFAEYLAHGRAWPPAIDAFLMHFKPDEPLGHLIARQEKRAADLTTALSARQAEIAEAEARIADLKAETADRASTIEALTLALDQSRASEDDARAAERAIRENLDTTRRTLDEARQNQDATASAALRFQRELDRLHGSKSWRVTKPLRLAWRYVIAWRG